MENRWQLVTAQGPTLKTKVMKNPNRIKKVGPMWTVVNYNGHTVFQSHSRSEAEEFRDRAGLFPATDMQIGMENVYSNKAFRDPRYFIRN